VIDRRPLLLFVSSESLVAILAPARNVKMIPNRISKLVSDRLDRLGMDTHVIDSEMRVMQDVKVGSTSNRSITGTMVSFARALPYYLPQGVWDESDLRIAEDRFSETPYLCSRSLKETSWPIDVARKLLIEKWQKSNS
jgi:hypothetical protein